MLNIEGKHVDKENKLDQKNDLQVRVDDEEGWEVERKFGPSIVVEGYWELGMVVDDGVARAVPVDDAVVICCCLAVNSTGMGSVKASSTLGNGPRGLGNKQKIRREDFRDCLLFSESTFGNLSKTRL